MECRQDLLAELLVSDRSSAHHFVFHLQPSSGNSAIEFSQLSGVASNTTSYATAPDVKTDYGVTVVAPGNSYRIVTFLCPADTAASYELKAVGGTYLKDFQDWNLSPIGAYITKF